jgi:hypothetical protein
MTRSDILNAYPEEDFIFLDGYDDAIMGVALGWVEGSRQGVVTLYDKSKVLSLLVGQGVTDEDALEYFEFNILGGYLGPKTPIFFEGDLTK